MIQIIGGKAVYVVEFDTMPALPITGTGMDQYYAEALTQAIHRGAIKEPGRYAIHVDFDTLDWEAYKVIDPPPQ